MRNAARMPNGVQWCLLWRPKNIDGSARSRTRTGCCTVAAVVSTSVARGSRHVLGRGGLPLLHDPGGRLDAVGSPQCLARASRNLGRRGQVDIELACLGENLKRPTTPDFPRPSLSL